MLSNTQHSEPAAATGPIPLAAQSPDQPSAPAPFPPGDGEPIIHVRNLVELTVLLLVTVLLVRTFLVEAYIVPTGSMAPALSGHHKSTTCPCCGALVRVGHRGGAGGDLAAALDREADRHYRQAACGNCGWSQLTMEHQAESLGDRLLVHKHMHELRSPQRWEMIVFRNPDPQTDPAAETLIKRLVGLPGERVQVLDGEVWINGALAQKPLHQALAMAVPIFDNDHIPVDAPRPFRWSPDKDSTWKVENQGCAFRLPASEQSLKTEWLTYRHLVRSADGSGWRESNLRDELSYNGSAESGRLIHDVLLECDVRVRGKGMLSLALTDGWDDVLVEFPLATGSRAQITHQSVGTRSAAPRVITRSWEQPRSECWRLLAGIVDRQLFVLVNGTEAIGKFDLPVVVESRARASLHRPLPLGGRGPVSLGARGADLAVSRLRLARDIHYAGDDGRELFPHGIRQPVELGPDEFFLLGDNSTNSYDSRCWKAGPAVRRDLLVGKAFFVHLPSRVVQGRFLGRDWNAQTPDWQRIRWLP